MTADPSDYDCYNRSNLFLTAIYIYLKDKELDISNTDISNHALISMNTVKTHFLFLFKSSAPIIGVGRFRILVGGGARFRILGGNGVPNFQEAHDVIVASMRRNDVASASYRRHLPTRFLINRCQIITFVILKSDNIENSSIELKGIVLPVPSNQIKVTFI